MSDSKTYLSAGRVRQKQRTQEALLTAAASLVREGRDFSIPEVADLAKVGRTTAYRYFPSVEMLRVSAALWGITGLHEQDQNLFVDPNVSLVDRVDAAVKKSDQAVLKHRNAYRAMLRASLSGASEIYRPATRLDILTAALSPLDGKIPEADKTFILHALSLVLGIEPQVILEDVCRVPPRRAISVKRFVARAVCQLALKEFNLEKL